MQPQLSLSYSSQAPIYGGIAAGWSLSGIHMISQDTSDGRLDDTRYQSSLAGGRQLVPVTEPTTSGVQATYRAKNDSSWTRYERLGDSPTQARWRAYTTDGSIWYFGETAHGTCPTFTATYAPLTRVVDKFGNTIDYHYRQGPQNECRIDFIVWGHTASGLQHFATAKFNFAESPSCTTGIPIGSQLSWRTGTLIGTGTSRLNSITVVAHAPGVVSPGVIPAAPDHRRTITLSYDSATENCSTTHAPFRQLASIQETAVGVDSPQVTLPAVTFSYGSAVFGTGSLAWPVQPKVGTAPWILPHQAGVKAAYNLGWGYRWPSGKMPTVEEIMIDLDGDGLLDRLSNNPVTSLFNGQSRVVRCRATWRANLGNGAFGTAKDIELPTLKWLSPTASLAGGAHANVANSEESCSLNYQQTSFANSETTSGGFVCPDGLGCPLDTGYCTEGKYDCTTKLTPPSPTILAYRWMDMDGDQLVDLVVSPTKGGLNSYNFYKGNRVGAQVESPLVFGNFNDSYAPCPGYSIATSMSEPYNMCGGLYPWIVYKNHGNGQFGDPPDGQPWPMPSRILYQPFALETSAADSSVTSTPIGSYQGVLDLNGDGRMDGVTTNSSMWSLWQGDRTGAIKPYSLSAPYSFPTGAATYAIHSSQPGTTTYNPIGVEGLLDINGDGLVDHWRGSTTSSTTNFAINDGSMFRVFGGAGEITVNVRPGSNGRSTWCPTCVEGGTVVNGHRWDASKTSDLDLDGRVDVTQQATSVSPRYSYLNLGGNFGNAVAAIGWNFGLAHTLVVSNQIPMYAGGPVSSVNGPYSWEIRSDMIDLDGDGIPEGVDFSATLNNPMVYARSKVPTPTAPPRLLVGINNGRGAQTSVAYAPMSSSTVKQDTSAGKRMPQTQWVVRDVTTTDVHASPQTTSTTSYHYAYPVFGADDEGRYAFRGFEHVTTTLPSGAKREETYSFAPDWSGRLSRSIAIPAEAPLDVRTIDNTKWEERTLFNGALKTYHATEQEHLVCFNGQTEATCTATAAAGYLKTTSTLAALATSLNGGSTTPLMYQETQSLRQAGVAVANGDRRTDTEYHLYADSSNYRLVVASVTGLHRLAGTFTTYSKTETKWEDSSLGDVSGRVPYEEAVWVDGNFTNRAVTRRAFDLTTGNVVRIWKPEQWAVSTNVNTNLQRTELSYDSRQLYPAIETNERGHVREYTYEYGTGTKLSTRGPNVPTCSLSTPHTCPAETPLKEEQRIRVDGLGRMIERFETVGNDAGIYGLHLVETNSYFDGSSAGGPQVYHTAAIDFLGTSTLISSSPDLMLMDGHGRPKQKVVFHDSSYHSTFFSYRHDGTLSELRVVDPTANDATTVSYTYTFDSLGRPTSTRRPDTTVLANRSGVDISYNGLSQTSTEIVATGDGTPASTTTRNDIFGRLVQVDEMRSLSPVAWSTTTYQHGPDDNVISIVDPQGVTTTLEHDFAGRRTRITRNTRVWTYGYDRNGNLVSETTPCTGTNCEAAYTTSIAYDVLDRPTSKALAPRALSTADRTLFGAHSEVFTWDGATNGVGRMSKWQSFGLSGPAITTIEPSYTVQGQQQLLTQTTNAAGYTNLARSFLRRYTLSGAVREVQFRDVVGTVNCQNGSAAFFTFDDRGLPYQVKLEACAGSSGTPFSYIRNTRNFAGLVTKRQSLPGNFAITHVESTWSYDKLGRVTSQAIKKNASLEQVARQDIAYFGNDDPKSMDHWLGTTNHKHFNFGYDARHQLTSVAETALPNAFTATYSYGNAGRFASAIEAAATLPNSDVTPRNVTYRYASADPERVVSLRKPDGTDLVQYVYDPIGNQTTRSYPATGERWDYVYDGKNQLRRVVKKLNGAVQAREEYWYDEKNARYLVVKRNASGTKTGATWFIEDTEAHYDATGAVTRAFGHVSMGTPVARIDRSSDAASTLEYQFHGLANNTLASVDQATGTTNASFVYAPFGEIIEATNSGGTTNGLPVHRRRMNDKPVDDVSGLAYYGFRYYDLLSMTWTQSDPLYSAGPDIHRSQPRRRNLYGFSLNSPLRYLDPDGLNPFSKSIPIDCGINPQACASYPDDATADMFPTWRKPDGPSDGTRLLFGAATFGVFAMGWAGVGVFMLLAPSGNDGDVAIAMVAGGGCAAGGRAAQPPSAGCSASIGNGRRPETRIVAGVTVKPKGKPPMTGNVDVGPTLDRIRAGGSNPHSNDGSIFVNKEGHLPAQPKGYYREYVHPTPGVSGPGPQRIVTGSAGELYYTPDHYDSFIPLN